MLCTVALLHCCTVALLHCCTVALCHCLLFLVHCLYVPYAIQTSLGCNKRFSILLYSIIIHLRGFRVGNVTYYVQATDNHTGGMAWTMHTIISCLYIMASPFTIVEKRQSSSVVLSGPVNASERDAVASDEMGAGKRSGSVFDVYSVIRLPDPIRLIFLPSVLLRRSCLYVRSCTRACVYVDVRLWFGALARERVHVEAYTYIIPYVRVQDIIIITITPFFFSIIIQKTENTNII